MKNQVEDALPLGAIVTTGFLSFLFFSFFFFFVTTGLLLLQKILKIVVPLSSFCSVINIKLGRKREVKIIHVG